MRRSLLAAFSVSLGLAALEVSADVVVLKDGATIQTSKPYVVKGSQALLTLPDGTLTSIPASQIDAQKTAAANAPRVAKPGAAIAAPPQSPGEAARQKGTRKATVVLSDEDILHPLSVGGGSAGGGGAAGERGATGDRVEVSGMSSSRENGIITVTGSLQNTGGVEVSGVSVTVEVVGDSNNTLASSFGKIAKDVLQPGEKTTFSAEFADEGVTNYRCVPRWQVRVPVSHASEAGAPAAPPAGDQTPAAAPPPAPTAPPPAKVQPRGDVAAPPASGPIGSPSNANSGYLPQPADVVPTPPPPK